MLDKFFKLQKEIFGDYDDYGVQDYRDKWWRNSGGYIAHWKKKEDAESENENEQFGCEPVNDNSEYIQQRKYYTFIYYDDGSGEQMLAVFDNKKLIK